MSVLLDYIKREDSNDDGLKRLLAENPKIDINEKSERYTPLHWAAMKGNIKMIKILLEKGADPSLFVDDGEDEDDNPDWGCTAIHLAAFRGYLEVVKTLIESGFFNINILSKEKDTLLHCAVFSGNFSLIKWLIDNGANINASNIQKNTPFDWAVYSNDLERVEVLIENGGLIDKPKALADSIVQCAGGDCESEIIEFMLENGFYISEIENKGFSTLNFATDMIEPEKIMIELVKLLIKKGANIDLFKPKSPELKERVMTLLQQCGNTGTANKEEKKPDTFTADTSGQKRKIDLKKEAEAMCNCPAALYSKRRPEDKTFDEEITQQEKKSKQEVFDMKNS
jgi:ankyrin repeat protein